jgi:hypothetical protein
VIPVTRKYVIVPYKGCITGELPLELLVPIGVSMPGGGVPLMGRLELAKAGTRPREKVKINIKSDAIHLFFIYSPP